MKVGLVGQNISHSISPLLFKAAYPTEMGLQPCNYELLDSPLLEETVEMLINKGYRGVNITTPYKTEVLKFVSIKDRLSEEIGASNLIIINNKKIYSYNTDYYGVLHSLESQVIEGDRVMILGCGGAGRAAAIAIKDMNIETLIVNRTPDYAISFAEKNSIRFCPLTEIEKIAGDYTILINASSEKVYLPDSLLSRFRIIVEANYRDPAMSEYCKKRGVKYISGLEWLLNQAIPSFELLTGRTPNIKMLRFAISKL